MVSDFTESAPSSRNFANGSHSREIGRFPTEYSSPRIRSELCIAEHGRAYLAVVLDLYSRFVVGWAISAVNNRHLTIKALEMTVKRRCPGLGLLHHSDQGSTNASEDYQDVLTAYGITCSMSRRGTC